MQVRGAGRRRQLSSVLSWCRRNGRVCQGASWFLVWATEWLVNHYQERTFRTKSSWKQSWGVKGRREEKDFRPGHGAFEELRCRSVASLGGSWIVRQQDTKSGPAGLTCCMTLNKRLGLSQPRSFHPNKEGADSYVTLGAQRVHCWGAEDGCKQASLTFEGGSQTHQTLLTLCHTEECFQLYLS